ncbi:MAG: pyridoxamine 5'-phosphate oxidase [Sandaracinus sp.]
MNAPAVPSSPTPDPIALFLADRERARAAGEGWDATAAALATVKAGGFPSVRFVLVKEVAADGFRFYTNRHSQKAVELEGVPHAALAFLWVKVDVQFRVEGAVRRLDDADSDAYFASRPRISQLGAWASHQSEPLASREVLLGRLTELEKKYPEGTPVPRPPHWGGYLLTPERIEHWQAAPFRLHERTLYERDGAGWRGQLINP